MLDEQVVGYVFNHCRFLLMVSTPYSPLTFPLLRKSSAVWKEESIVIDYLNPIWALWCSRIGDMKVYARLVRAREATRSYPLGRAGEIRVLPR